MQVETPAGAFRVGGIAKGAGMIEPMLATMLAFVTTDAQVRAGAAATGRCDEVAERTFNAITVDGECSTNDTLVALASGAAASRSTRRELRRAGGGTRGRRARRWRWRSSAAARARPSWWRSRDRRRIGDADAMRAAKTIANSPLVKTAVHGADPNWGRLVAASGPIGRAVR